MSSYIRRFWAYLKRNETAKGLFLVGIVILAAVGIWWGVRVGLNTEFPLLVVSSGSMCPPNNCTLAIGALIVIRGQAPETIEAGPPCSNQPIGTSKYGSIIVFRDPARGPDFLIVHRVRAVFGNQAVGFSFQTEGDANSGCDPVIPFSRVVGVYQYTVPIPYLGSAILAIRSFMYNEDTGQPRPQGIAVIVALIIALFAFEVIEPSKKKKQPSPPAPPSSPVVPAKGKGPGEPDGT